MSKPLQPTVDRSSLTDQLKTHRLVGMSQVKPTVFGLSTAQLAILAKQAVGDAVRATVQAGNPVTGLVDGKVETLSASDPRLSCWCAESRHLVIGQYLEL